VRDSRGALIALDLNSEETLDIIYVSSELPRMPVSRAIEVTGH
jgi:hypothetical protein